MLARIQRQNVDISAKTRNEPHNTVTPIARFNDENHYVIDMILRNNRTDKAHPFGIFHPTEDLHNIKKKASELSRRWDFSFFRGVCRPKRTVSAIF